MGEPSKDEEEEEEDPQAGGRGDVFGGIVTAHPEASATAVRELVNALNKVRRERDEALALLRPVQEAARVYQRAYQRAKDARLNDYQACVVLDRAEDALVEAASATVERV